MKLKGNNLIIVNILATYVRILLVAGMGLFSTRWVLKALGKEDFGLYSVVGGLIIFILFIGNTMAGSVQRFYAYAIGRGDSEEIKKWFNTAFVLHISFVLILVLIGVPVGNYLLDYVMEIPSDRLSTCHWVYHFSIIGAVGTMLTTPYLGMFYAKQRIFELSFWSLLTAIFSFILAWCLLNIKGNLLFIYALGMVSIKLALDIIQIIRAYILFDYCRLKNSYFFDRKYSLQLISFAFWNLFGAAGMVLRNQGIALLINMFSGPKINASFGIANQVASQTNTISSAIYQAMAPEITSREGAGNREKMITLSLRASKFVIFITLLWLIPLYLEMDYVLNLWLTEVPDYAIVFCRIILLAYFIEKLSIGYMGALKAHGKIAGYQVTLGGFFILTFPLAWIVYYCGGTVIQAVSMIIVTSTCCSVGRVWWMKKLMNVPYFLWINSVLLKCFYVALPSLLICAILDPILDSSFLKLTLFIVITFVFSILGIWIVGLDNIERTIIKEKIVLIKKKLNLFC